MKTNIFIAIPTYRDLTPGCVTSLLGLIPELSSKRIGGKVRIWAGSDIVVSRNFLASLAFADESVSHLLFIDSDMEFRPSAVSRMLDSGKPLIGCVYPKRELKPAEVQQFVVYLPENTPLRITSGMCVAEGIGMGLCLIAQETLRRLAETGKVRRDTAHSHLKDGLNGPLFGFFDPLIEAAHYCSEDLSFCRRWSLLCGGETWAIVDEDMGHAGPFTFRGKFSDRLLKNTRERDTSP